MAIFGTLGENNLSAISASISDTAVDVFVYDTTKDSDGGAWRKRTRNTSWYNETLNTATRGSRKEFPAVAVIVAESLKVTIYDGDDPDLPMWMVFHSDGGNCMIRNSGVIVSVTMLNAELCVGRTSGSKGLGQISFITEVGKTIRRSSSGYLYIYKGNIEQRNDSLAYMNENDITQQIAGDLVYDVAMTVLPNAPIDSATGLPTPTIAVATDGGVSVIKDDGNIVDITASAGSSYSSSKFISMSSDGLLVFPQHGSSATSGEYSLMTIPIPSSDRNTQTSSGSATDKYIFNDPNTSLTSLPHGLGVSQNGALRIPGTQFLNYPNGLAILDENPTSLSKAMVAYIKFDHNTGWMQGDIKGAFLSDTDTTDKTNGQADPDRSVNNNALTVNGTITKSAVATGADLVGYGGWSTSNYLEQPYNSDLNFGSGDFYVMGWAKPTSNTNGYVWERAQNQTASGYAEMFYHDSGQFRFYINGVGNVQGAAPLNTWTHFVCLRQDGVMYMFINGVRQSTTVGNSGSLNNTSAKLRIGIRAYDITAPFYGEISLIRIGGGAPSTEQIKKMYEDEKVLFQENAKATLYGSSDAVTALAYDDATNLLHVGTSAGRSEFQGLRRINNTTDPVTTAISAHDSLIIEQ